MFEFSFVDWDNTVYNSVAFEADIFGIFSKHGASQADIRETYTRSLCTIAPHKYDYTFEEHTQFLRELGYNLPSSVEAELNSLFSKNYIFPDTLFFLDFLKGVSKKIVLLSAGDQNFQLNKINGSKIKSNFDEIKIVGGDKEKYLANNYKGKEIFFVNDNLRENLSVKTEVPSALVITKFNTNRYSEEEVKKVGVPYFKTLTEIQHYVEQQIK